MANRRATGKKAGGAEIVQYVRRVLIGAFEVAETKGLKITEILAKEIEANPLKFLEVASKYCPKEVAIDATVTHRAEELSDDQLADIASGRSTGASEASAGEEIDSSIH